MKTGDIVKVRDGSYSLELTKEGLKHTYLGSEKSTLWRITDVGLTLPGETFLGDKYTNDTILHGVTDPKRIVFVQERFLDCHTCPTCNRDM